MSRSFILHLCHIPLPCSENSRELGEPDVQDLEQLPCFHLRPWYLTVDPLQLTGPV